LLRLSGVVEGVSAGVSDGVVTAVSADVACSAWASWARRWRRRSGVPKMYSTMDSGSNPYNTKVTTAPSTVPWVDKASATDIISTT